MVRTTALLISLIALSAGCVIKSTAEARERAAFLAGRQSAFAEMQQTEARGPMVTVVGPVQHALVKWVPGLTLSQAIVQAVYTAPTDPRNILIRRNGQVIPVDPKHLLAGQDAPLEVGDVVELQQ
jgi:hypothetical protein